ncbi:hypothetical protein [Polycladomyces subterraneus]|uniref:Uncharacterized protein n=1 Tax=Polycladomyces subterraneus TaxID=1016997 RepID=A0ABT8IPD4_9BACL|nr:hypothetical protein [Polycladomyces subterraneus]MDN4594612.1 hypothetical protein [Polycladomyces subterraneus]
MKRVSSLLVLVLLFLMVPGVRADNTTSQGNRFTLPQGVFYRKAA